MWCCDLSICTFKHWVDLKLCLPGDTVVCSWLYMCLLAIFTLTSCRRDCASGWAFCASGTTPGAWLIWIHSSVEFLESTCVYYPLSPVCCGAIRDQWWRFSGALAPRTFMSNRSSFSVAPPQTNIPNHNVQRTLPQSRGFSTTSFRYWSILIQMYINELYISRDLNTNFYFTPDWHL